MISRRRFIAGCSGAALGAAILKLRMDEDAFPRECVVRFERMEGPKEAAGKRAVFLTDLHCGNGFGAAETTVLSALVRRLQPELVLMGGDLADTPLTDLTEFFSGWSPGCPTVFAPGNHDLPDGDPSASPVVRQASAAGFLVLCNASERWRGWSIVGFPSVLRAEPRRSLLAATGRQLLLAHEPDCWDWFRRPGLVQLSGHTHGGQMRFFHRPVALPTLGKKYPLGRYARDSCNLLVVSAGVGCSGPRVRFNCPPEITALDFV
jgi:predicted MPP superfamily phosphohydrolase